MAAVATPVSAPATDTSWLPWLRQHVQDALEPWIEALADDARFSLGGSSSDAPSDRPFCIDISTIGAIDERVFEAIELLALLGGVDPTAFSTLVSLVVQENSPSVRVSEHTTVPIQCTLMMPDDTYFPEAIKRWSERMVVSGIEATGSDEYRRLRGLLESAYETMDATTLPQASRIRRDALVVAVELQAYRGDFESVITQLAQVVMMQDARDSIGFSAFRPHAWKPIFRVTDISPPRARIVSPRSFLYLSQIASRGINLSHVWIERMDVAPASAALFAQGLQELVGSSTLHRDGSQRRASVVNDIRLPSFMTERIGSAVFSALMVSQSVKRVTINSPPPPIRADEMLENRTMTRTQRTHLWKWVAIALFSRLVAHQLEEIELDVQDFNLEDTAAVRAGIGHPEAVLLSAELSIDEPERSLEKVTASRFLLSAAAASVPIALKDGIKFDAQEVFIEDREGAAQHGDWLRVVLPGCGRAWVHRASTSTAATVSPRTSLPRPSPNLCLTNMNDQSMPAVLKLLTAVGPTVKDLSIVNITTSTRLDDWLLCVVRACPHLDSLAIAGDSRIASMDVFAKMYEHVGCQVRFLRLYGIHVDDMASVSTLLRRLGDETVQITKHLQLFTFTAAQLDAPIVDVLPVLDSMLRSNTLLQFLHLSVMSDSHIAGEDIAALHRTHQGKPVAVRQGPLGRRQKYAFCSVVASFDFQRGSAIVTSDTKTRRVVIGLDRHVLTRIFEFAAECKTREVMLRISTHQ